MGDLGDRMKRYEAATRFMLTPRTWTVIRIDGKNFHSFTRGCDQPFDYKLMDTFEHTARRLTDQLQGAVAAYHQSDEISVVLQDFTTHETQPWLGGVVQKQASIAASIATAQFNDAWSYSDRLATFDARVFTIPNRSEVMNYLIWRQQDALRNSVNMVAGDLLPHAALHRVSRDARLEMIATKGVDWAHDFPVRAQRGTLTRQETYVSDVEYERGGKAIVEKDVTRTRWVTDQLVPVITEPDGWAYMDALLPL